MGPILEKVIILIGMFFATLFASIIPLALTTGSQQSSLRRLILSLSSCFSGGVFLAALFLDLFPDVHEAWDHVLDEIERRYNTTIDYPLQGFVTCCGFFIVLIVEQIILEYKERSSAHRNEHLSINGDANDEQAPLLGNNDHQQRRRYASAAGNSVASLATVDSVDSPHQHHDHSHLDGVFQHSTMRSLILLLALSFHSIFEGLAIGLQQDLGQLISLFLAVIAHKGIMAFSLGLTLAQANLSFKQFLLSVLIFSLASPFGMGIGILLSNMEKSLGVDIANAVLQGTAGGTFIYITFFEVLPHEFNQPGNRMLKCLFTLLGFSCITGLIFITH